jgi:Predicted transcriptional regulators
VESNLNLLLYRKRAKLGQRELAEKLGLTRQLISMFESGKVMPMHDTAVDIARILGVDPGLIWPEMFKTLTK